MIDMREVSGLYGQLVIGGVSFLIVEMNYRGGRLVHTAVRPGPVPAGSGTITIVGPDGQEVDRTGPFVSYEAAGRGGYAEVRWTREMFSLSREEIELARRTCDCPRPHCGPQCGVQCGVRAPLAERAALGLSVAMDSSGYTG